MATFATLITAWSLGVLLHWWPRLSVASRRRLGVVTNIVGLVCLIAALRAEGPRETTVTSAVLLGTSYRTAIESAQASYSYYVLTATCLLLGFAALGFGEALARWLRAHPLLSCTAVAWLITLVRLLLEKSAAPTILTQAIGVTWMIPIAGAYIALTLPPDRTGWRPLARRLVAYAFLVRGMVALASVVATRRGFGTHYDVSSLTVLDLGSKGVFTFAPAGWLQLAWLTLLPQLAAWPVVTVLIGLLAGIAARRLAPSPPRPRLQASSATPAADSN